MLFKRKPYLVSFLVLIVAVLACSISVDTGSSPPADTPPPSPTPPDLPTEPPTATPTATEPAEPSATPVPADTATLDPLTACPPAPEGTVQIINEEQGFCLLYPEEFDVQTGSGPSGGLSIIGEPLNPDSLEPLAPSLRVSYNGPAQYVSTSQEYADLFYEQVFPDGAPKDTSPLTLTNAQGVVLSNVPGRLASETLFVVKDGHKYGLSLTPPPGDFPDLEAQLTDLWQTVTDTIVFFTPAVVPSVTSADEACPPAGADTTLHRSLLEGVCFLVPADAIRDATFQNGYYLGTPMDIGDFRNMRANVVVAYAGPANGQTIRASLQGAIDAGNIDVATVQDVDINGYPAVTWFNAAGPFPQRHAKLLVDDRFYTIVSGPYDAQRWPEFARDIDRLWNTITGSISFFTRWQ